jgi:RimJ/RimL family protein N-acetyltransferase
MGMTEAPSPTLRTARLLLEPYTRADEDDFVALFQDERVTRWMGDGPESEQHDRDLFDRLFTLVYAERRFDVWAVRCPQSHRLLGHAEIKHTEQAAGHEIIYALHPDAWGVGLGTELAEALVAYGFGTLELPEVHATVADENAASLAVLTRIGFRHVRDIAEDDGHLTRLLTRAR